MTTVIPLKRIDLHVDILTYDGLREAARDYGLTVSQLVNMIIEAWLYENGYSRGGDRIRDEEWIPI